MRTLIYLALTAFICSFCALANIGNHSCPYLFIVLEFGPVVLFFLYQQRRRRRINSCRRRAFLHEQCMRVYLRQNGYRF